MVYYNAHKDVLARTLIAAHHSFGFFARKGGASMTTVIEIYEQEDTTIRQLGAPEEVPQEPQPG